MMNFKQLLELKDKFESVEIFYSNERGYENEEILNKCKEILKRIEDCDINKLSIYSGCSEDEGFPINIVYDGEYINYILVLALLSLEPENIKNAEELYEKEDFEENFGFLYDSYDFVYMEEL